MRNTTAFFVYLAFIAWLVIFIISCYLLMSRMRRNLPLDFAERQAAMWRISLFVILYTEVYSLVSLLILWIALYFFVKSSFVRGPDSMYNNIGWLGGIGFMTIVFIALDIFGVVRMRRVLQSQQ